MEGMTSDWNHPILATALRLADNQTRAREGKFPADFVHSRDLTRVFARRNIFERNLKLHGHCLRTRWRYLSRINGANLKCSDAALVEKIHADLHPARLLICGVRLCVVDIEIHIQS